MAETKHGGSPALGLVPAGLEQHSPAVEGGRIIAPEIARTNAQAKDRALQFERRRLALPILSEQVAWDGVPSDGACAEQVAVALKLADELLKQTGGVI